MKAKSLRLITVLTLVTVFGVHSVHARSLGEIIRRNLPVIAGSALLIGMANSLTPSTTSMYPTSFPPMYSNPYQYDPYLSRIDQLNGQYWGGGWGGWPSPWQQSPCGQNPWSQQSPWTQGPWGYQNPWGAPWAQNPWGQNPWGYPGYGNGFPSGQAAVGPVPVSTFGTPFGTQGLNQLPINAGTQGPSVLGTGTSGSTLPPAGGGSPSLNSQQHGNNSRLR